MISGRHLHHPATHRLALIAGISAFVVAAYWTSFSSMWDLWQTSDHRHGLLVFPISVFLVWRMRDQLGSIQTHVNFRGLILLLPLAILWVVAQLAGIQVVQHLAVLAMIPVAVLTLMGTEIARKLLFPLAFLVLATPISDAIVPHLMVITTEISTALLNASGIPVFRDGQYFSLSGGSFVVADVCSGTRYFVTGVMISLLFGYLTFASVTKRVLLVAGTAVALVFANGLRAYIVMAVASASNMEYLGGRDHIYFGWLLFGIVMMLILWIGARFTDESHANGGTGNVATVETASHAALPMIAALGLIMLAVTVKPLQADFGEAGAMLIAAVALLAFVLLVARRPRFSGFNNSAASNERAENHWVAAVVATTCLAILIVPPRFVAGVEAEAGHSVENNELISIIPCNPVGPWANRWRPIFQAPDVEHALAFSCSGQPINVYVAAYASPLQRRELVNSSHHPVPPQWDRYSSTTDVAITGRDGEKRSVAEVVISSSDYKAIVWYWYDIDGQLSTGSLHTKVLQVLALAQRRPAGGRIVVIETPTGDDPAAARKRLALIAGPLLGNPKSQSHMEIRHGE